MTRRTKIVATLGPATDDPAVLRRILIAGVDVVRLNYSHGKAEDHARRDKSRCSNARAYDSECPRVRPRYARASSIREPQHSHRPRLAESNERLVAPLERNQPRDDTHHEPGHNERI